MHQAPVSTLFKEAYFARKCQLSLPALEFHLICHYELSSCPHRTSSLPRLSLSKCIQINTNFTKLKKPKMSTIYLLEVKAGKRAMPNNNKILDSADLETKRMFLLQLIIDLFSITGQRVSVLFVLCFVFLDFRSKKQD